MVEAEGHDGEGEGGKGWEGGGWVGGGGAEVAGVGVHGDGWGYRCSGGVVAVDHGRGEVDACGGGDIWGEDLAEVRVRYIPR